MKLSAAALFAVTTASCPTGWSDGVVTGTCVPDGVTISCSDTTMTVSFSLNHVYEEGSSELDATQQAAAMADISGQTDAGCVDFTYDITAGSFSAVYDIDTCTTAAHDSTNGLITFTNSFIGDEAALLRDGIITTKVLSFEAQCQFLDSATVAIDGITVDPGTNVAETVSDTGSFTFNIESYIDSLYTTAADATNKVEIGDKVYTRVWTTNTLPAAIEYHVTDCTAYETYDAATSTPSGTSYNIFNTNTCVSDLISASVDDTTGTTAIDTVDFSFNSFTFSAAEDTVALVCTVKLCLASETTCFVNAVAADCGSGYTAQ